MEARRITIEYSLCSFDATWDNALPITAVKPDAGMREAGCLEAWSSRGTGKKTRMFFCITMSGPRLKEFVLTYDEHSFPRVRYALAGR